MMLPVRLRFGLLVLGLGLCVAAAAEEHKAASEHGTASKSATTASKTATSSTKPAVAFATFERAQAKDLALDKKPAKDPSSAPAPEPVRSRPLSASVPRHNPVTMAALSAQAAAEPTRPIEASKAIESPAPAVQHKPHSPHWSYEGETGPHAWAKLAPEFAKCGSGQRQSPIDIREGMKLELEPITFEYRPSSFKVVDNGHTIQASVNGWNSMRLMGRVFRLVQFHFHRPSEEMIDGKQFEMVVHLVHKDSQDRLAVVAVLVEVGARQPVIQTVLNNLPLEKGEEVAVTSASLDLSLLLPQSRRLFHLHGLAHNAALQRRRALGGHEATGPGHCRPAGSVLAHVSDERAPSTSQHGKDDQGVELKVELVQGHCTGLLRGRTGVLAAAVRDVTGCWHRQDARRAFLRVCHGVL